MNRLILAILAVLTLMGGLQLNADVRDESIDIFLVLDKSLSMVEEIDAVKKYINTSIVDNIVQKGDYVLVIQFYGKALNLISHEITNTLDKEDLKTKISAIIANGRWTDIGNALDSLNQAVKNRADSSDRRTFLLLITDGIQEAPPESIYYTPDGSFNHFFLENTKIIQQEGWKIHILGIGTGSAAKELAHELSGSYSEVSENPDQKELEAELQSLTGTIEVLLPLEIRAVDGTGMSELGITLVSSGYKDIRTVEIDSVAAEINGNQYLNIVPDGFSFVISPEEELTINIPVIITPLPPTGTYESGITLYFNGNSVIIPAVHSVEIRIKGWLENNLWIIPVLIVILALIIVLSILIRSKFSKRREEDKVAAKLE